MTKPLDPTTALHWQYRAHWQHQTKLMGDAQLGILRRCVEEELEHRRKMRRCAHMRDLE